jgi:hypothetical protein
MNSNSLSEPLTLCDLDDIIVVISSAKFDRGILETISRWSERESTKLVEFCFTLLVVRVRGPKIERSVSSGLKETKCRSPATPYP